jgi:hypothetical protein
MQGVRRSMGNEEAILLFAVKKKEGEIKSSKNI